MADWFDTGEAYAASFAALCEGAVPALLDEVDARVTARGRLLDVGTGPGTVLDDARRRGWTVHAADAEASMVAAARRRFPDVVIDHAALPALPYGGGEFDAATANFVLNHVPVPVAAVRELSRVARAVAVTVWSGSASPLRPMWDAVLAAADVSRPDESPVVAAELGTPDALAALLSAAGLSSGRTRIVSWDFAINPGALWNGVEGGVASVGGIYRGQDDGGKKRMRRAYDAVTSELVDASGLLVVPHEAVVGSGLS